MTDTAQTDAVASSPPRHDLSDASTGELVSLLTAESSQLIRDEIALAKAEVTERAKAVGVGAGLFGAAGVLGWFGLGTLIAAAKERTGVESTTELVELALATLALPDPVTRYMVEAYGVLGPDHQLDV